MQRGFTIVEMAVAVGILALLVAAGGAFALGMRPFEMRTAATQFDAQLEAARSLAAATGNGATIIVTGRPDGGGFKSTVYGGRPNGSGAQTRLMPTTLASIDSGASIDVASLSGAPFAIFLASSGRVSIQPNYPSDATAAPAFASLSSEPQTCPQPLNAYTIRFSLNGATHNLSLPCSQTVSGTPSPVVTNSPTPGP